MPSVTADTPLWLQLLPGATTTLFGSVLGYFLGLAAERRANKRTLDAEARARHTAAETERGSQERTKQAIRDELLLVLESVRGKFNAASLHPALQLADNDPATGVLFTKAFAHETGLALTVEEARDVREAALRANRIATSLVVEHRPKAITNRVEMDETSRRVASAAQDVIQLVDKAIKTLGGPLDRSRSSLEPPS